MSQDHPLRNTIVSGIMAAVMAGVLGTVAMNELPPVPEPFAALTITPTPWHNFSLKREPGAVDVTITGWIQDPAGAPIRGYGYVELTRLNEAGWPTIGIERKYFIQQHSFVFQRALSPGAYAVILDDSDLGVWYCAQPDRCWCIFEVKEGQDPIVLKVVWTLAREVAISTIAPPATATASLAPTPPSTETPCPTGTPIPTFTPSACNEFQQFTYGERLSIIATSAHWIGHIEEDFDFVSDATLFWGWDMRLGAPLSPIFWVTGEDGQEIMCRAFCQAIIATRNINGIGPPCYQYGIVDWFVWDGALESLPKGE